MADLSRRGLLRGALVGALASTVRPASAAEPEAPPAPSPEAPPEPGAREIRFTLNGEPKTFAVGPDERAVDLIRRRCGLTGTKESCGAGSCGACTVTIEGVPQVSCLLPAVLLDGQRLGTVEGLAPTADPADLHPVQRAFLAEDALQCGYCTPGFVVEAAAFHDRWRAEQGATEPDRDTIAAALAGHLCRCGAYPAIFRAVAGACRGDFDGPDVDVARHEGPAKVTGRAKYTVDVRPDGTLDAAILRSPHAHARLRSLDLAAARRVPGVRAVIALVADGGLARFAGQEIAAVAAIDPEAARAGVAALAPTWDVLPAVTAPGAAVAPGAVSVYATRKDGKAAPAVAEVALPATLDGNLRGPTSTSQLLRPRKGRDGVARAAVDGTVGSGRWETGVQLHTPLEPHAVVARPTEDGGLELWASTQSVRDLADDVAQRFGRRRDQVVVHAEHVGGGFGAKVGLQLEGLIAVELAIAAGAPVRVALDRHEELAVGGNRPGHRIELAIGADAAGELAGITYTSWSEGGVGVGNVTGFLPRFLYETPNKDLDDYDIVTHAPPGRPFRGPGGPPAFFALEGAVDQVALARGEDPVALRRRWDPSPVRAQLYEWVEGVPTWRDRGPVGADTGRHRRGVGLAAGTWFQFWDPASQVELEAGPDGIVVRSGTQDMGNGVRSLLARATADRLGVRPADLRVEIGHSTLVHGPMASGSRCTASLVPAAEHAADQLIDALTDLGLAPADALSGGMAGRPPVRVVGRRKRDAEPAILPVVVGDLKVGRTFPGVVTVAEVRIDTHTGVSKVTAGHVGLAVGRIVNERTARSQVEGSFVQNVGYALFEERVLDPASGRTLSHNLDDYRIPGLGDVPSPEVFFAPGGFEHVRGGATGLGELGGVAVAAAIANAVHHALGRRPYRLPLTPPRVRELSS